MACGGKLGGNTKISFYFITLNFLCYYCSIDFKRQSEHLGPRPDTSSLVVMSLNDGQMMEKYIITYIVRIFKLICIHFANLYFFIAEG